MQKIKFNSHDREPTLQNKSRLKKFIENLFKKEKIHLKGLAYIFCSDEYLIVINKEFLKHDFFTDVITFNLSSCRMETEAEVYISIDRVKDNAKRLKNPYKEELHRVIFHGALHLCGYNDKTKKDKLLMRLKEEEYLMWYFNKI